MCTLDFIALSSKVGMDTKMIGKRVEIYVYFRRKTSMSHFDLIVHDQETLSSLESSEPVSK